MLGYLIVLAVALGTTLLTTPLVRVVARRIGAVGRGHVPRVPGRHGHRHSDPQFDGVFASTSEPLGVVLGATIICTS
jgi:UDP-N-acetylmuramyl pentapeptide phosphotransferase/UDP-N-acetylglucosamine-1-phosphate transferase